MMCNYHDEYEPSLKKPKRFFQKTYFEYDNSDERSVFESELDSSKQKDVSFQTKPKNNEITIEFIEKNISQRLDNHFTNNFINLFKLEEERMKLLEENFKSIQKKITSLSIQNLNNLNNTYDLISSLDEMKTLIEQSKNRADVFHHNFLDIENRIRNLENISEDGTFLWKIENIKEKIVEAKMNRLNYIDSCPFYTSKYFYKMCIRLYLNGEGVGKGTHLGVYFIIMEGDYDSLLKWPFEQKIKFILLDQNSDRSNDLVETFKPDSTWNSFKKPLGGMKVASGIPLFCSFKKLVENSNFIKDNMIFIKTIVDLTGIYDYD